ncbi:MAG: sensor histidine kinase [Actinomycetota bacterium]|nr:sensor histidine kinase [Actinomycetota bacterium]
MTRKERGGGTMLMTETGSITEGGGSFRHEALMYSSAEDFLAGTAPFIRDAVDAGEPIWVIVTTEKIDLLRSALGDRSGAVRFADMADVGHNPAWIIPAWRDFVDKHADDGRLRGIGEPIWATRSAAQLVECERHEALLNLAFAHGAPLWLLCPYDSRSLSDTVIQEAHRTHPFVAEGGRSQESGAFLDLRTVAGPFARPLSAPPDHRERLTFRSEGDLRAVRAFISHRAAGAGLDTVRTEGLVLAVNEVITNSIRYASGSGELYLWHDADAVICEVQDDGHIGDPLIGRTRPTADRPGGFGMWMVNQLCDLVQVRTFPSGSVVRLHVMRQYPAARRR